MAKPSSFGVNLPREVFEALLQLPAPEGADSPLAAWLTMVQQQVDAADDPDRVRCCADCGSLDIEVTAWVMANGDTLLDRDPPLDTAWCPSCECDVDMIAVGELDED